MAAEYGNTTISYGINKKNVLRQHNSPLFFPLTQISILNIRSLQVVNQSFPEITSSFLPSSSSWNAIIETRQKYNQFNSDCHWIWRKNEETYSRAVLGPHDSIPFTSDVTDRLSVVRLKHLSFDLVGFTAIEWFGKEVYDSRVSSLLTADLTLSSQFYPRHGQDRSETVSLIIIPSLHECMYLYVRRRSIPPAVATRKGDFVFFLPIQERYGSLSNHMDTDGQTKELGFGPDVTVQCYPLLLTFGIESGYCNSWEPADGRREWRLTYGMATFSLPLPPPLPHPPTLRMRLRIDWPYVDYMYAEPSCHRCAPTCLETESNLAPHMAVLPLRYVISRF